ncbi:MAG: hypothetical protein CMB41_05135 [Euryarchaeota archaeon]|nr:hypothetical protein [Euryarchaeota archaeon]
MARLVHAVAGRPVAASASPLLFLLTVARLEEAGVQGIALEHSRALRIEATTMEGVFEQMTEPPLAKGGLHDAVQTRLVQSPRPRSAATSSFHAKEGRWLSLTSPLKHLIGDWDCVDDAHALLSVNALRLQGDQVRSAGTDGAGVLAVARLAGCGPNGGAILRMRGGGGAARSVAHAWVNAGGRVHLIEGRRPLTPALPESALAGSAEQAALGIDFDGEGGALNASKHLIPAYQNKAVHAEGSLDETLIDGRWMLVAQHLEAWRILWAPELQAMLPSIPDLMEDLVAVEALLDGR